MKASNSSTSNHPLSAVMKTLVLALVIYSSFLDLPSRLHGQFAVGVNKNNKTLFTWSGGPRFSGVSFFCFVCPRAWKQKKPTPLDRSPPLHVNRPLRRLSCFLHLYSQVPNFPCECDGKSITLLQALRLHSSSICASTFTSACVSVAFELNLTSILCSNLYGRDWLQTCTRQV